MRRLFPCFLLFAAAPGCGDRIFVEGFGEGQEPKPFPPACQNGQVDPSEFCHEAQPEVAAGIDPCALTTADFDEDGRPDAAVPNSDFTAPESSTTWVASLLRTDESAQFEPAVSYPAGGRLPVGIASGDFDGDGHADIVTANWEAQEIAVLHGDGRGHLSAPTTIATDGDANAVAADDLDGDGLEDVVAAVVSHPPAVAIVRSPANADQSLEYFELPDVAGHVNLADIDDDGHVDLLATAHFGQQVFVARGDGAGSFGTPTAIGTVGFTQWVVADDITHDGHADLIVAMPSVVDIFPGNGEGNFGEPIRVWVDELTDADFSLGFINISSVATADFDQNGYLDLVVSDDSSMALHVMLASAPADFQTATSFETGSYPVSVQTDDFNLDGVPDIAVANQLGNTVTLVLSEP